MSRYTIWACLDAKSKYDTSLLLFLFCCLILLFFFLPCYLLHLLKFLLILRSLIDVPIMINYNCFYLTLLRLHLKVKLREFYSRQLCCYMEKGCLYLVSWLSRYIERQEIILNCKFCMEILLYCLHVIEIYLVSQ